MELLQDLTTYDLALNLATGQYSEKERIEALVIIRSREILPTVITNTKQETSVVNDSVLVKRVISKSDLDKLLQDPKNLPKGAKTKIIQYLISTGLVTAKEIADKLAELNVDFHLPEIYRVLNKK